MERVWVEVILVMTVRNTDVTPRSLQTFARNELALSSELNIALNIEAVAFLSAVCKFQQNYTVSSLRMHFSYILGFLEQIA
jgi:hypothetical protein